MEIWLLKVEGLFGALHRVDAPTNHGATFTCELESIHKSINLFNFIINMTEFVHNVPILSGHVFLLALYVYFPCMSV
jgi:hypothetical protein